MTCAALRSVRVVSTCTWRGASFFVSHRVTCRIGNTPPWSSMGRATTVSARCQVYSRPVSPVKATSVNCSAGRSGMVPLRQVSGSNPAAAMCANRAAAGFDPLTWRKGTIPDLPAEQFTDVAFTGETGREYTWHLADTVVALPIDDHGGVFPIRQVTRWDTKKLAPRAISAAASNTITALARDIRLDTGYARANHEAHTLARHVLTHSGDIDPAGGVLTVRLDPMPTARATAAIRELCEHLTAT